VDAGAGLSLAVEIVVGIVAVLIAAIVVITFVGRSLPVGNVASRTART